MAGKFAQSIAVIGILTSGAAAFALPNYEIANTSFEAPDYSVGAFNSTDTRWTVQETPVNIVAGSGAASTAQFVQLGSGAILDFALSAEDKAETGSQVWIEGYFRGTGSDVTLAEANYPISQASAIVHFSEANGIEAWDGTKSAAEAPTSLSVPLGTANATTWFKITIALDFEAKTWDVWVNNAKKNSAPLGFRDTTLTALNGFKNLAQGGADFDGFRIVRSSAGDVNGDTNFDSADVVRMIEYMANEPVDDPILLGNLNVTTVGDQPGDILRQEDLTLLVSRLTGATP